MAGRVIILNGTSSAGKDVLARAVHDRTDDLWIVTGQDDFTQSLVPRYVGGGTIDGEHAEQGFRFVTDSDGVHVQTGAVGRRVLAGYRQAVAALANAGNSVVVAEAKFDADGWNDWTEALQGVRTIWVAVRCNLDVCEQRERARPDRIAGLARGHFQRVHTDAVYDAEVDLTNGQVVEAADSILRLAE